ncbi:MAG: hypothetical protein JST17_10550 [Bacteroidetes bacterium]|nr:hypothetical protein [Bacteroidota bacterium]MBS1930335.1 hypothetical protein [Bacteroidota bacterium]
MRKNIQAIFIPLIIAIITNHCAAQDSSMNAFINNFRHSFFKASVSYLSNDVYFGRKDSINIPYITPSIRYYNKSGIFFSAGASYLSTEKRIDAYTLGVGYIFASNKWDGEITVNKYFFNSQSYSVKSEVKGDAGAELAYNTGPVEISLTSTASFSSATDIAAGIGLDHSFSFIDDNLEITPTVILNGGTQYYYDAYYRKRRYVKKRKGQPDPRIITAYTLDPGNFRILDYEASLPVEYDVKKFRFGFTPTITFPVNPNTIVRTVQPVGGIPVTKTYNEKISNSFLWELELGYKF